MGAKLTEYVFGQLHIDGIPANMGMPGTRMPVIDSGVVAIQVAQVDHGKEEETVLLSVLVPASMGAIAAENLAYRVADSARRCGGVCRQEKAQYLKAPELFCVEVYATFYGTETASGWQPTLDPVAPPSFSVTIDQQPIASAVSFTSFRETDEEITVLKDATWHFKLEELCALDSRDSVAPLFGFTLVVQREGRTETYMNCDLTSQTRILTKEGFRQIREGRAEQLSVVSG